MRLKKLSDGSGREKLGAKTGKTDLLDVGLVEGDQTAVDGEGDGR